MPLGAVDVDVSDSLIFAVNAQLNGATADGTIFYVGLMGHRGVDQNADEFSTKWAFDFGFFLHRLYIFN